jgi:hypothetical protein
MSPVNDDVIFFVVLAAGHPPVSSRPRDNRVPPPLVRQVLPAGEQPAQCTRLPRCQTAVTSGTPGR